MNYPIEEDRGKWEWYKGEKRYAGYYIRFDWLHKQEYQWNEQEIEQCKRLTSQPPVFWKYMYLFREKQAVKELTDEEIQIIMEQTGKHPLYFYYRRRYEEYCMTPKNLSEETIEECKKYTGSTPLQLYRAAEYHRTPVLQRKTSKILMGLGVVGMVVAGFVAPKGYTATAAVYGSYLFNSAMISMIPYLMNFNFAGRNMAGWEGPGWTCFLLNGSLNMFLLYQTMLDTYVDGPKPLALFKNQFFNSTMWAVNGFSCFFMALLGSSRR
mmetsp:Transcript_12322/g.18814  ORF Transcript_12322/g.18814 Transcript_12322/m.18814 type:complete len:267 (-) Transcript_12322:904-1704(-)|eukprot:CAMPEP_0201508056 /NCGR_PEP_ID=MMETSP0161_2-20130828/1514_1 /ASSEMBLY_ACC=CAM_ASM_000251 /TAXON_ID=180227 /ORGANISM="Neoparamoeba aestuarina, Strain SoJaBio B1-5/56/2" /LENGTH=266 /DNA_ID=CAMNT_0047902573 /DNA_START=62 /DNA_END=862 /DNA_ORIENTATION=+